MTKQLLLHIELKTILWK